MDFIEETLLSFEDGDEHTRGYLYQMIHERMQECHFLLNQFKEIELQEDAIYE
jgi:hypothetical protein